MIICWRVLTASSEAYQIFEFFEPMPRKKREKHTSRGLNSPRDDARFLKHREGRYQLQQLLVHILRERDVQNELLE